MVLGSQAPWIDIVSNAGALSRLRCATYFRQFVSHRRFRRVVLIFFLIGVFEMARQGLFKLGWEVETDAQEGYVTYLILKFLHIIGAAVILGTGAGIAFFMLMAHRSGVPDFIARTAGIVVVADVIFTATAVLAQPVSGYLLVREIGVPLSESWVIASLGLYLVAGLFWLPVVWIQIKMRDLARQATQTDQPLSVEYYRLFRIWFAFGVPGFSSVLLIFWLMIAKPSW